MSPAAARSSPCRRGRAARALPRQGSLRRRAPPRSCDSRVPTLPRRSATLEIGPQREAPSPGAGATTSRASRPAAAPRASPPYREMKTSRTSARGRQAAMTMPSGRRVGRSLAECTPASIAPERSASSISLVNSPLPPTSGQRPVGNAVAGRADRPGSRWPPPVSASAAASAARVASACTSASGLPRRAEPYLDRLQRPCSGC